MEANLQLMPASATGPDPVLTTLANKFIERAEALGYRGKKRDEAALDFMCGAATAIGLVGDPVRAQHIHTVNALIVAVRGYMAVRELALPKERRA